ncbi:MAG: dihydrofolate reductase [Candidimonas sp.]|jgi:dihydrofolate reductase
MPTPTIALVVAYSTNRVIGRDNMLPWRLKADLAHFKRVTMGHPIVMGRKTWESLGRPLPGRPNLVISRNADYKAEGATVYPSLEDAIAACRDAGKICVIGGEDVFRQALPLAGEIIATEVHAVVDGDTFFPLLDNQWLETDRQPQPAEDDLTFDFVTYLRPPVV